jgi:tetratricopeptide (TPR) repeat protein
MIVRNESKVIERLLRSVCPLISHYCICDTGSTDDTCARIDAFFRFNHPSITGAITYEPFRDFSYNRNVSLNDCMLRFAHCDAILLMDADMVLKTGRSDYEPPDADYYYIMQGTSTIQYKNIRIIKMDRSFHYIGTTHEYLNVGAGRKGHSVDIEQLRIQDIGDGGCKEHKFTRDIALLHRTLEHEPTSARALFYLANSYKDIGKYADAISYYKKRIGCDGWREELYLSAYRTGLCHLLLGNQSDAILAFLSACNYSPCRLESLHELIQLHRLNEQYSTAMGFYVWAKSVAPNDRDFLLMQCDVYDFKIDYEYTIIAFYSNKQNIHDSAVRVLNRCPDHAMCRNVINNLGFYNHVTVGTTQITDALCVDPDISNLVACLMVNLNGTHRLYVAHKDPNDALIVVHCVEVEHSSVLLTVATSRFHITGNLLPHVRVTSSNDGSFILTYLTENDSEIRINQETVVVSALVDDLCKSDMRDTVRSSPVNVSVAEYLMAGSVAWVWQNSTSQCCLLDMSHVSSSAPTHTNMPAIVSAAVKHHLGSMNMRYISTDRPPYFSHVCEPFHACMCNGLIWCIGVMKGRDDVYNVLFECDSTRVTRFSGPLRLHANGSCVGMCVEDQQARILWMSDASILQICEYRVDSLESLMCYNKDT